MLPNTNDLNKNIICNTTSIVPNPFPPFFNLNSTNTGTGFIIKAVSRGDLLGYSVKGIGDINGDGIGDLLITAPGANSGYGAAYVIFGNKEGFPLEVNVNKLDGHDGFQITPSGSLNTGISGWASGLGDIDGDGVNDFAINIRVYDKSSTQSTRQLAVIYGNKEGFPANVTLNELTGSFGGFIVGDFISNTSYAIRFSETGDMNYDGVDDFAITTPAGEAHVVYGSRSRFPSKFQVSNINGENGFNITDVGYSWSIAGGRNFLGNGEGAAFIGNYALQNANGEIFSGGGYVILSNKGGFPASFSVSSLTGPNGFVVNGIKAHDTAGVVGGGYDINNDGYSELFISANAANGGTGQAAVILGWESDGFTSKDFFLYNLNGKNGFIINGASDKEQVVFVTGTKDLNGDSIDDIIVSTNLVNSQGLVFIIYGRECFPAEINLGDFPNEYGSIIGTTDEVGGCCQLGPISGTPDLRGKCGGDIVIGDIKGDQVFVVYGHGAC